MNAAASGGSSSAISSSIFAQRATARVCAPEPNAPRPACSTAASSRAEVAPRRRSARAAAAWPTGTGSRAAAWRPRPRGRGRAAGGPFSSASLHATQDLLLALQFRRRALLQVLLEPLEAPLDDAEVGEDQFLVHRAVIARGIEARRRAARSRRGTRAATWTSASALRNGATSTRSLAPAAPAAGHVRELHRGRDVLPRVEHRGQAVEAGVGDARDADVGVGLPVLAGTDALAGARHEPEQRGLAGRGVADESCSKHVGSGDGRGGADTRPLAARDEPDMLSRDERGARGRSRPGSVDPIPCRSGRRRYKL